MIANIKTVAVYVSDQKEALRFYTEKLGFEVRRTESMGPDGTWVEVAPRGALPDGNCRIGSFFDLNLELTLDDGQTWTPSSVTGHVEPGEP